MSSSGCQAVLQPYPPLCRVHQRFGGCCARPWPSPSAVPGGGGGWWQCPCQWQPPWAGARAQGAGTARGSSLGTIPSWGQSKPLGWFRSLRGLRAHRCVCFCCNKLFCSPPPMGRGDEPTHAAVCGAAGTPIPQGLILLLPPLGAQCWAAGGCGVWASPWLWLRTQRV